MLERWNVSKLPNAPLPEFEHVLLRLDRLCEGVCIARSVQLRCKCSLVDELVGERDVVEDAVGGTLHYGREAVNT